MNTFRLYSMLILCGLLIVSMDVYSQAEPGDTTEVSRVKVDHADVMRRILTDQGNIQEMAGNIELRQDSLFFYCDSAIIKNNTVDAFGHVIIQEGDSVNTFANMLFYDGNLRTAELRDSVVLDNGDRKLFAQKLFYDLNSKIASYNTGAILFDKELQLISKVGRYSTTDNRAFFSDSVEVVHSEFELKADSIYYLQNEEKVVFLGRTNIYKEGAEIYCESGYYNVGQGKALFSNNAQYKGENRKAIADYIYYDQKNQKVTLVGNAKIEEKDRYAEADTIIYFEETQMSQLLGSAYYRDSSSEVKSKQILYDGLTKSVSTIGRTIVEDGSSTLVANQLDYTDETGLGVATGDVIWVDTTQHITIIADVAEYRKSDDYVKAYGLTRPLLINEIDGDTIYISADTLFSFQVPVTDSLILAQDTLGLLPDSNRLILAYHDVRIFKSDFQAVCDSMSYEALDSTFRFYRGPIIWSDTVQLTGDTVLAIIRDDKIDEVQLIQNGFIISSTDHVYYDQVKGRKIWAYFKDEELHDVLVRGNAESYNYVLDDDDAYIGLNKSICSELIVLFESANKIDHIRFLKEPKFNFLPMRDVLGVSPKIEGFKWHYDRRPKSKEDLIGPVLIKTNSAKIDSLESEMPSESEVTSESPPSSSNVESSENN